MNFKQAVISVYTNYFNFKGRASRSEIWWFSLFCILVSILLHFLDAAVFGDDGVTWLGGLFSLFNLCPNIMVITRRLHDINRSGWWQLIMLVPLIGFVMLYWFVKRGDAGPNRFGPDPLAQEQVTEAPHAAD